MKSRILGLIACALIGASGSAASMGDDAADPNLPIVYLFWSPILTGTLDGQPFEGQLTASSIFYGTPPGLLFSIDGVHNGIGGLVDRVSPTGVVLVGPHLLHYSSARWPRCASLPEPIRRLPR